MGLSPWSVSQHQAMLVSQKGRSRLPPQPVQLTLCLPWGMREAGQSGCRFSETHFDVVAEVFVRTENMSVLKSSSTLKVREKAGAVRLLSTWPALARTVVGTYKSRALHGEKSTSGRPSKPSSQSKRTGDSLPRWQQNTSHVLLGSVQL